MALFVNPETPATPSIPDKSPGFPTPPYSALQSIHFVTSVEPSKSGKAWIEAKVIEETGSHVEKHEKTEEVMNIPLMSYYILYNVLTAYLTHYVTSLRMRAAAEQKFRRALRQN